ncbi:unnamed protein product [Pylaiella littoralis]
MDEVWETGRRHVKISKLYLKGLLKRGPNIFVALAWSQAFWLTLEATAGNEDSHGFVRLSSVACYALALHTGGHLMLNRYSSGQHKLSHHALEFLLDLVTDVVGFAWINAAEEMLAQVFEVRAKTALVYAVLAFVASLGAMEIGSLGRSLLGWPVDSEETANQFDAGSFALPTSWLITQGVHIGLYGFFYRTAGGQGGRGSGGGGGDEDNVVDIRLAASFFFFTYAVLCSIFATRVIGGTVAASTVAVNGTATGGGGGGGSNSSLSVDGGSGDGGTRNELLIQAISSYEISAAQVSDATATATATAPEQASPAPYRGVGYHPPAQEVLLKSGEDGDRGGALLADGDNRGSGNGEEGRNAASLAGMKLVAEALAAAQATRVRREYLRRGLKAYMRLTVAMMVGWAYNLWGQVEFRQEELEFRFGPALGAIAYAALSTGFGVCIMVRGADKLDSSSSSRNSGRRGGGDGGGHQGASNGDGERMAEEVAAAEKVYREAIRSFHARRLLVVVGGFSLVVGWAWEEAFDLVLEGLVGDEADAGTVVAKLTLAVVATAVVLGREIGAGGHDHHHHGTAAGHTAATRDGLLRNEMAREEGLGGELLEPLVTTKGGDTETI